MTGTLEKKESGVNPAVHFGAGSSFSSVGDHNVCRKREEDLGLVLSGVMAVHDLIGTNMFQCDHQRLEKEKCETQGGEENKHTLYRQTICENVAAGL